MAKGNIVYRVFAGTEKGCVCIYETTKQDKAERYVSDLQHSRTDYTKIYIDKAYSRSGLDKRNYED